MIGNEEMEVIKEYCIAKKLCKRFKSDNVLYKDGQYRYKSDGQYRWLPYMAEILSGKFTIEYVMSNMITFGKKEICESGEFYTCRVNFNKL